MAQPSADTSVTVANIINDASYRIEHCVATSNEKKEGDVEARNGKGPQDVNDEPTKDILQAETTREKSEEAESEEENQKELRESGRMLLFVDAVVAIAITLLVLPLLDAAAELAGGEEEKGGEAADEDLLVESYYAQHGRQILCFLFSFLLVFKFWTSHIMLFAYVDKIVSNALVIANELWIFTIMMVPLATTLYMGLPSNGNFTFIYCAFEANFLISLATKTILRKYPATQMLRENAPTSYSMMKSWMVVGAGAVAVIIGAMAGDLGWLGFVAFFIVKLFKKPTLLLVRHVFKIEMEMSPVDKVTDYYTNAGFIHMTFSYVFRKLMSLCLGPQQRQQRQSLEDDEKKDEYALIHAHKETSSRVTERLILMTDASVAISMTLLIVPLSDRLEGETKSVGDFFFLQGHLAFGFVISFFIIFRFWKVYDDIYVYVDGRVPPAFLAFTAPWLITIVFIPVSTALLTVTETGNSSWKTAQYILNLLLNKCVSMVLAFIVFHEGKGFPAEKLVAPVINVLLGSLALGLSFLIPGPYAYTLALLFFLPHPISSLLLKIWPGFGTLLAKIS